MSRLRQQNPYNYVSSEKINSEFENIIRYINAAELGNKTLYELLDTIFNEDTGEFDGPIFFRFDGTKGLQYRIGNYTDPEEAWITITSADSLRGAPGMSVGQIDGPFFYNRQDSIPLNGVTVVNYAGMDAATGDVLVYINGVLQPTSGVYTVDFALKTITFGSPFNGVSKLTLYCVRTDSVVTYQRSDQVSVANQTAFPFVVSPNDNLLVWRNGILQEMGPSHDYIIDTNIGVIFTAPLPANDKVTIITVYNDAMTAFGGLMTTSVYAPDGFIPWSVMGVSDGAIAPAKVAGLANYMANGVLISAGIAPPDDAHITDLWINTSVVPNQLYFCDGTQFISTNPSSTIPEFLTSNAGQYLRVNGTGTAFEYGDVDLSSVIPKTQRGAANGVATLDADGLVPTAQVPPIHSWMSVPFDVVGTVTNVAVLVQYFYGQIVRIHGLAGIMGTGSCTVQVYVDGAPVGPTVNMTTVEDVSPFNPIIQIDATTDARKIEINITSAASTPANLHGCLNISTLAA